MKDVKELRAMLRMVLKEYTPISEAPTLDQLWNYDEAIEKANMQAEEKKCYKSIDSATGDIYLIANNAIWEWIFRNPDGSRNYEEEARNRVNTRIRPRPKFMMSYADAKQQSGQSEIATKRNAKVKDINF